MNLIVKRVIPQDQVDWNTSNLRSVKEKARKYFYPELFGKLSSLGIGYGKIVGGKDFESDEVVILVGLFKKLLPYEVPVLFP
jgi:hypothetical protein